VSSSLIRHRRVVDLDPATGRILRLSQRLDTTYAALVDGHIDELHGWITAWALSMPTQEVKAFARRGIYSQVGRSTTKVRRGKPSVPYPLLTHCQDRARCDANHRYKGHQNHGDRRAHDLFFRESPT
jgi:hypothetical protein